VSTQTPTIEPATEVTAGAIIEAYDAYQGDVDHFVQTWDSRIEEELEAKTAELREQLENVTKDRDMLYNVVNAIAGDAARAAVESSTSGTDYVLPSVVIDIGSPSRMTRQR
jgi:fructosamine-3-kinase